MGEEKKFLRERLEKIADSPVQANTDEPQTEAKHRKKEERLRNDCIRHHLSSTTTIVPAEGDRGRGGDRKNQRRITVGIGAKSSS